MYSAFFPSPVFSSGSSSLLSFIRVLRMKLKRVVTGECLE
jgi:hypothetical protein